MSFYSASRQLALALGFAVMSAVTFSAQATAMKIQEITTPGGINVWLVERHSTPLIALRFVFTGGSAQDPAGLPGVANFVSVMLDEGAGELPSAKYQERMEDLAMRMSFEDGRDGFYGDFSTLTANRDASFDMLRLALNKPIFENKALDRMRAQLIAGLAYREKDPRSVASRNWAEMAFGKDHPYAWAANGTAESLPKITSKDLEDYRSRVFARDNLKVVVVGDIDAKTLITLLDKTFGDLPAKAKLNKVPDVMPKKGPEQKIIEMDVPQSVAQFGMAGLARHDKDFLAAYVLNQIVGSGGFSSLLMEEVREKRGLAYGVYSYLHPYAHSAIYAGSVATKNEKVLQSLDVINSVLKQIAKDGPTEQQLRNAKDYLTGSFALRFDTSAKIASQLLYIHEEDLGLDYVDKRNKMIEAVTLGDVKRVAARLLHPENLLVTIVGKPVMKDAKTKESTAAAKPKT